MTKKVPKATREIWCSSYGGGEDELDGDGKFYLYDGVSMDPYLYYDEKGKQITKQKYWKIMDEEN